MEAGNQLFDNFFFFGGEKVIIHSFSVGNPASTLPFFGPFRGLCRADLVFTTAAETAAAERVTRVQPLFSTWLWEKVLWFSAEGLGFFFFENISKFPLEVGQPPFKKEW